ncbi:MAG: response regulator transcription factor [Planctomycetota bacterium]
MSDRPRILIVEDDATLRDGLQLALRGQDLVAETAADGHLARRLLGALSFDLVVLDLMLPGPSGLELLRELRARDRSTPVIVLTARADESDKVLALELGADDYVTKPFGLRELIARVRAHLRRAGRLDAAGETALARFRLGAFDVDLGAFRVLTPTGEIALSPKEAAILALLFEREGRAVHRNAILDAVWGRDSAVTHRTIDTHVLNLRQKIEGDPKAPRHLLAVHGIGYRLVLEANTSTDP